jgi:transcriptional regulator with GAF, ATPase, and Fis domain
LAGVGEGLSGGFAATNRNLEKMVADREFRSDLFYRLNVFPIRYQT